MTDDIGPPSTDPTSIGWRGTLTIGWRVALSTSLVDALLPLATSERSLDFVREVVLGLIFAVGLQFGAFVLLVLPLGRWRRSRALGERPLACGVSLALATAFGVLALDRPMVLPWSASVVGAASAGAVLVLVVVPAFVLGLNRLPRVRVLLERGGRVAPLAGFVVLGWLLVLRATPWFGEGLLAVAGGAALVALLATVWRLGATMQTRTAQAIGGVAFAGLGLAALLLPRGALLLRPVRATTGHLAPRHVVLLTVDSLRADALSRAGSSVPTPHLDALFADSVVFEAAQAPAPWTLPSCVSLLSGTSPWVHGATRFGAQVPEGLPHVAEFLRDAGYRTAGIGHNYFLTARGTAGFASRGFEHYEFYPKGYHPWSVGLRLLQLCAPRTWPQELDTTALTDRVLAWLQAHGEAPSFLWVHYLDPHSPYAPPSELAPRRDPVAPLGRAIDQEVLSALRSGELPATRERIAWMRALYLAEVRWVDEQIGRLVRFLRERGWYDDALIVVTSDHGEEFYEHRSVEHGHTLHGELLHVPLAFKLPRGEGAGTHVAPVVSTESLAATLLDVCGIPFDPTRMTSPSLAGFLGRGHPPVVDRACATGLYSFVEREAIVSQGFKYVRSIEWGDEELYDLAADPGERSNLAAEQPERVRALRAALAEHVARSRAVRRALGIDDPAAEGREVPEEDRARLRAIGY